MRDPLPPLDARSCRHHPNVIAGRISKPAEPHGRANRRRRLRVDGCSRSIRLMISSPDRCDVRAGGRLAGLPPPADLQVFCNIGALVAPERAPTVDASAAARARRGAGMMVLMRREDAGGTSSDIRAVRRSGSRARKVEGAARAALEGEALAIARAYQRSGIDPATSTSSAHGRHSPRDRTESRRSRRCSGPRNGAAPTAPSGSGQIDGRPLPQSQRRP